MEFFTVSCSGRGEVFIDDNSLGENKSDGELNVFQCNPGNHYISMNCMVGKPCRVSKQLVNIINTNPISPMEVYFKCAS
jgi:hypothetical protein